MLARKIDFYIESSASLRKARELAQHLANANRVYQSIAPEGLGQFSGVSFLGTDTLCLNTSNGAIAAKLKQLYPQLLQRFRERGFEITAIRVEVQVRQEAAMKAAQTRGKASLDKSALIAFEQLNQQLETGMLRMAVKKLLARHTSG